MVILRRVWPIVVLAALFGALRVVSGPAPRRVADCDSAGANDVARLEECAAVQPADEGLVVQLGEAYEGRGDHAGAESAFRRALAIDPEDGNVHRRLARLLAARGDQDGAVREAAAARALQPGAADGVPSASSNEGGR